MQGEIMRIICDHCSRPISGTVKRTAEKLNLHPDCLAELAKEGTEVELTDGSFGGRENQLKSSVVL
jgi:hypothetical protein